MTFKYRYRKQIIIGILILILLGSGISYFCFFNSKKETKKTNKVLIEDNNIKKKAKKEEKQLIKEIMIDVKGEVNNPGIYKLQEGSRVVDAINLAGGITNNGDTSVLNLSKKLIDEMVIIVYSYYEVKNFEQIKQVEENVINNCKNGKNGITNDACIDSSEKPTSNSKISLNNATLEELMTLSGIGESKAKSIIEYREQKGGFTNIEELKEVDGIGESLFDKIKENITL